MQEKRSLHYQTIPPLRRMQRMIANHRAWFKVVACGRRWGKTTLGLVAAINHALNGKKVWWVAPTYGMAFQPWQTLKRRLAPVWTQKIEAERHIDLPGGGSITVKSADDPDTMRGVGLDLVVVDEAAFLLETAWVSCLRPALADREGQALILSAPCGRNWFYHVYQRGQDPLVKEWKAWRFPTSANPDIKPEKVEEARALLLERVFRQEFEAVFLEDGGAGQPTQMASASASEQTGEKTNEGNDVAGRWQ